MYPRSKSRNQDTTGTDMLQMKTISNPTWTDNAGPYTRIVKVNRAQTDGFDIPNYHKKLREGGILPFTTFNQSEVTGEVTGSYYTKTTTGDERRYYPSGFTNNCGSWVASLADVTDIASDADLQDLVNSAAARIYSSGWDALTFASEFHKVVRMFGSAKRTLLRIVSDPKFRARYLDDLLLNKKNAKTWLEYRYGWRTLMYDVKDLRKAINNLGKQRARFKDRVGYGTAGTNSYQASVDAITGACSGEYVQVETSWNISYRGAVVADIEPPTFQINPLITGWELVPFSFVIDWFITVGKTLEALSFLSLSTAYAAAYGFKCEIQKDSTYVPGTPVAGYTTVTLSGSASSRGTFTSRTPTSVSKVPSVKVNLDVSKLIDLASLLRVRL